jgi:hypothetical protein
VLVRAAPLPGVEGGPPLVGVEVVLGAQGWLIGRGAGEVAGTDGIELAYHPPTARHLHAII